MSQQQAIFVEEQVDNDWVLEEHLFCCDDVHSLCGLHFDKADMTESTSQDPVECRLCFAIQQGDDITWRCKTCGCGVDEDCGRHW